MRRRLIGFLLVLYAVLSVLFVARLVPRAWYPWAAPLLTLLAVAIALFHASVHVGWRETGEFFALSFVVSLGMETFGVRTGWVFGAYHYTQKLMGPRFGGLVPLVIPLAWFMMMYPSWVIARALWQKLGDRSRGQAWKIAALAGLAMTAWDVLMDPLMVHIGQWVWETPGGYFGIPARNFLGWWLTVFITVGLFETWAAPEPLRERQEAPLGWMLVLYGLIGGSNLVLSVQRGLTGSALAGFWAMVPWLVLGGMAVRGLQAHTRT